MVCAGSLALNLRRVVRPEIAFREFKSKARISDTTIGGKMSITVGDYLDVQMKLSELGLPNAIGLALLPTNLASARSAGDLLQASEAATVRSLFRSAGLGCTELPDRAHGIRYIQNNAADWVGPTVFVAGSLWSQNPLAISVALNVVSNYLTDLFKGLKHPTAKLDFIVEKTKEGTYKHLAYEGDIEGIIALEKVIRGLANE